MNFLGSLCLILFLSTFMGHLSARLNLPVVVGQLLVGIIIGPAFLNWLRSDNFIEFFSELGVILLMFIAGLESNIELLKRFLKTSIIVAISGMITPIIIACLIGILFNFNNFESLFLGVVFAATSVSISIEVLKEMNSIDSKEGTTILGAAVVDDILAVLIVSIISSFAGNKISTNSADNFNLVGSLLLQATYFIILLIVGRWIIPHLMKLSSKLLMPFSETLTAIIICLALSYLADWVGLSAVIGAFFAGLSISQTTYKKLVTKHLDAIGYSIFIPVFFTSIGLEMTFSGIIKDFSLFLILTIGGICSKLLGAGLGAKVSGFSWHSALIIGAGMISRGEMALVVAQIGVQNHLLSKDRYSAVIGAIIMTTIIAPFLLKPAIGLIKSNKSTSNIRKKN